MQDDEADSTDVNHHFIKAALPHLVPLLLEQLTKQVGGWSQVAGWLTGWLAGCVIWKLVLLFHFDSCCLAAVVLTDSAL